MSSSDKQIHYLLGMFTSSLHMREPINLQLQSVDDISGLPTYNCLLGPHGSVVKDTRQIDCDRSGGGLNPRTAMDIISVSFSKKRL